MAKPIKITVRGTEHRGDDAPTVEDFLCQIQDFVAVLRGIEEAVADDGNKEIVWRVTNVTRNSPLTFEVTPYSRQHAMNIGQRAEKVVSAAATGFEAIAAGGERPRYFTDQVTAKARKIYDRVTNGLAGADVDFSAYADAPSLAIDKQTARQSAGRIAGMKRPRQGAHREIGSLEGYIVKVELDGFNRPIVGLRSRLDGKIVKCVSGGDGLDRIGHFEVVEVLRGRRVRVHGILHYNSPEQISRIDVEDVHVFPLDSELPDADTIVSPNFTGGLESSAYLKTLREDG